MKRNMKNFILCIAVMMLGATGIFAGPNTECLPSSPGNYHLVVGVASNFFGPSQDMIDNFIASTYYTSGTSIQICHDSTTVLKAESSNYDVLFLADGTAGTVGSAAFSYAKGLPVYFAKNGVVTDASALITKKAGSSVTPPSGLDYTISGDVLSSYSIVQNATQSVAVADLVAPYGIAARDILNSMLAGTGFSLTNNPPPWVHTPLFSNIALTFKAVVPDTTPDPYPNIQAGFVSKAQICAGIAPNVYTPAYVYVEFTNPLYTLNQTAAIIDDENDAAWALYNFIQNQMEGNGTAWKNFLATHCYGQP